MGELSCLKLMALSLLSSGNPSGCKTVCDAIHTKWSLQGIEGSNWPAMGLGVQAV